MLGIFQFLILGYHKPLERKGVIPALLSIPHFRIRTSNRGRPATFLNFQFLILGYGRAEGGGEACVRFQFLILGY